MLGDPSIIWGIFIFPGNHLFISDKDKFINSFHDSQQSHNGVVFQINHNNSSHPKKQVWTIMFHVIVSVPILSWLSSITDRSPQKSFEQFPHRFAPFLTASI